MGYKRLSTAGAVVAYVLCLGVPFWWWSTSITRPVFDASTKLFFQALADDLHKRSPSSEGKPQRAPELAVQLHVAFLDASDLPSPDADVRHILQDVGLSEDHVTVSAVSYRNNACSPIAASASTGVTSAALEAACTAARALAAPRTSGHLSAPPGTCPPGDDNAPCIAAATVDAALHTALSQPPLMQFGVYYIFVLQPSFMDAHAPWIQSTPSQGVRSPSGAYLGVHRSGWLVRQRTAAVETVQPPNAFTLGDSEAQALGKLIARITVGSVKRGTEDGGGERRVAAADSERRIPGMRAEKEADVRPLPVSAASEVTAVFGLIVEDATEVQGWQFEPWDQALLQPLAKKLQPLLSLRIESQVRLFASARLPPGKEKPAPIASGEEPDSDVSAGTDAPSSLPDAAQTPQTEGRSGGGTRQESKVGGDEAGGEKDMADLSGNHTRNHSGDLGLQTMREAVDLGAHTADGRAGTRTAEMRSQDLRTVLEVSELPFFVDLDAWSLGFGRSGSGHVHPLAPDPHLIPECLLNFVGYVPAIRRQPMGIAGEPLALGFAMPGWGAVTLINQERPVTKLPDSKMEAMFGSFVQHFRELLGLVDLEQQSGDGSVVTVPCGKEVLADWELDFLMRSRFRELIRETAGAVITLLELVETLPNLEMPLSIGKKVDGAREHMQAAMIAASELDYARALHEAREARTCAEVAATHHTIVSQHSYPEQHKVALYLPFFGPISMPLISALIYEVKRTMRLWS